MSENITSKKLPILITLFSFFITLQSYYFHSLRIAPFPVLGAVGFFLIAVAYFYKRAWNIQFPKVEARLLAIVGLSGLVGFFSGKNAFTLKPIFGFVLGIFVFFVIHELSEKMRLTVIWCWLLHMAAWILQFAHYYCGFGFLDLLSPITGEKQRYLISSLVNHYNVARMTGLFNEPATYTLMISALAILVLKEIRVSQCRPWIYGFTIVSCFFSFSLFGWMSAILFFWAACRQIKGKLRIQFLFILLTSMGLLMTSSYPLRLGFLKTLHRSTHFWEENSYLMRFGEEPTEWSQLEPDQADSVKKFFLGQGLGNQRSYVSAGSSLRYLVRFLGYPLTALFLWVLCRKLRYRVPILLLGLFLIHAPYIQHPVFWWVMSLAAPIEKKRQSELTAKSQFF